MRRLLRTALACIAVAALAVAAAQSGAVMSGIVKSDEPLADNTRVAIHVVDSDNVWGLEVATVAPVGGTFRVSPGPVPADQLRPFRSGSVILPGLQNEYRVSPEGVNVAVARFNMYVDQNGNDVFDRVVDRFYIGVASLEAPVGFFTLLYVDQAATLTGGGVELPLRQGWNVFTVRFPGDKAEYAIVPAVEDIVLDVVLQ
ncbi:MAG TPA: hypothetical protein PKN52_09795 [Trueperaceae bacterium]|jgi:hypothetical protein|nr:hypothetical protein [Trueperaceae bacterium]